MTEKRFQDLVSLMQFMVCYEFWDAQCVWVDQLFMSHFREPSHLWEEAARNERMRGGACWCRIISPLSYIKHQSVMWFTERPDRLRRTGWPSAWAYHGANEDHTPRAVIFINLFALVGAGGEAESSVWVRMSWQLLLLNSLISCSSCYVNVCTWAWPQRSPCTKKSRSRC